MKTNEFIRLLKKHGCFFVRQAAGSHEVWKSSITGNEFVVPNHPAKEIGTGLANKILKQAGIK